MSSKTARTLLAQATIFALAFTWMAFAIWKGF